MGARSVEQAKLWIDGTWVDITRGVRNPDYPRHGRATKGIEWGGKP